jgi:hypothetical protein
MSLKALLQEVNPAGIRRGQKGPFDYGLLTIIRNLTRSGYNINRFMPIVFPQEKTPQAAAFNTFNRLTFIDYST